MSPPPEVPEGLWAEALARWTGPEARAALTEGADASAEPGRALGVLLTAAQALERAGDTRWSAPEWIAPTLRVAGASRALSGWFRRHPEAPLSLAALPSRDLSDHLPALSAALEVPDPAAALRRYRQQEMARIAARDLSGQVPIAEIAAEIAALAEACLEAPLGALYQALVHEWGEPPARQSGRSCAAPGFCVLGMGKLGGRELNFSSDIDVIYVYERDGSTSGGASGQTEAFQFYAKLAERLGRLLSEVSDEGFVFRVDPDLRPEGRTGPLVNSLNAMEAYYESYGRTWERQALIKARPCAGDLSVGEACLERLRPFVWRRSVDLETVESITSMKASLDQQTRSRGQFERDLKLGRGGIRTVEFVIQSLQLLQGGRDPALRSRSSLPALDRLLFAGHLSARDHQALGEAYAFLRRAEHRIQLVDDRQTHRLPAPGPERLRLARAMGFTGSSAELEFSAALERHRDAVEAAAARRFGREAPVETRPELFTALDREALEPARLEALEALGLSQPAQALAALRRLERRPWSPLGRAAPEELRGLMATLLTELGDSPDPDQGLAHLAEYLSALPRSASEGYLRLLQTQPPVRRLLLSLFGGSDFLSRYFLRHPELLDLLVMRGHAALRYDADQLMASLSPRLAALPPEDEEAQLAELRRFRHETFLRIGLADISGALDTEGVLRALSALAEVLIAPCVALATRWAEGRWGRPLDPEGGPVGFTVVGLGKLGGRELGYGSDLDLLFLYEQAGKSSGGRSGQVSAQEYFIRLTQRLLSYLGTPMAEGRLYEVDTRLRPSGNQGLLVTSLPAFEAYHQATPALWERQALTRARPLLGPAALRARAGLALERAAYRHPHSPGEVRRALWEMRSRVEEEIGQEDRGLNPKAGRGGLIDIEFLTQQLQLIHGGATPRLRTPSTLRALSRLQGAGLLAPQSSASLSGAYLFLRRLENRLRLLHDRPIRHLPAPGPTLDHLARRMGYLEDTRGEGRPPGAQLLADYQATTETIRREFEARSTPEAPSTEGPERA